MTSRSSTTWRALAAGTLLLLAACATPPPASPQPVALTSASPEAMVAAIRAAAGHDDSELAVQPLRDPMVEDLREDALRLESRQQYAEAAAALDKALGIVPEDPALLQERAEAALLLRQFDEAERLARHAFELGAKVGPLCRRHWATVRQARLVAGDAAGAQAAQVQVDGCKVAGPNRF
jgi:tetratricopeptide (TPR) repeat protein